ncbi:MAG: Threonyl-tRNA synthetase [uncultured bacterium]|nr:MAG: Threonyl-tRNA synthetase [uncultured bacterium]
MTVDDLQNIRHSAAHLLAAAVKQVWPGAKNAIGPAIDTGFYQDFDMGDVKVSEDDLGKIEDKMREILKSWGPFVVQEVTVDQARQDFADNPYKLELINDFGQEGKTITENNPGNFLDLCKGGHADDPQKQLRHFKLLSIAGAYWRGDETKKMLTRIYGTCFPTKNELQQYLHMLAEARQRDHKKLGVDLDLFTFSSLVGPGLPLWTPKGTVLRHELDNYVWELRQKQGYQRVEIPHITKKDLYITSGHWDKYQNDLFKITTREGHEFAMKPMNCPHHTQIYARRQWSYRELPQRYANTTTCYRDEQSGELAGLSRVRSFTQDDAHVFCRIDQVKEEVQTIWTIVHQFYATFGLAIRLRLSLRDPQHPENYLGNQAHWDKAEAVLREIAQSNQTAYVEALGEAAFYAPKLDFMAKDSLGREWQVATIQLDVNMPDRFDLTCIGEDSKKERIVMIHAAIMGSIDRFLSIIIEHFAGAFPAWLAPIQVQLLPVGENHVAHCQQLAGSFTDAGLRIELDDANETIGNKVRKAAQQHVPYIVVVGDKEIAQGQLAVRLRGSKETKLYSVDEFLRYVQDNVARRLLTV